MRHFLSALMLSLFLLPTTALADITDILGLQQALHGFCGPRKDVILVDESHSNPPCLMSYSEGCEEIQPDIPQSCAVVLRAPEEEPGRIMNASWH